MICSICLNESSSFILKDNIITCINCMEIQEWGDTLNSNKKPIIKKEKKIIKKILTPTTTIRCSKCKNLFSEQICKCGYINPLFRKF